MKVAVGDGATVVAVAAAPHADTATASVRNTTVIIAG